MLPARTHPFMSMSATGGYLLSGIKVAASQLPMRMYIIASR